MGNNTMLKFDNIGGNHIFLLSLSMGYKSYFKWIFTMVKHGIEGIILIGHIGIGMER